MWPSTIFEGRLRSSQTVLVEGVDRWSKAQYPVCEGVSRVTRRLEPARNTWANFWISTRISVGSPGRSGRTAASVKSDRKSTRLNSSHSQISYAVFCLKKKKKH